MTPSAEATAATASTKKAISMPVMVAASSSYQLASSYRLSLACPRPAPRSPVTRAHRCEYCRVLQQRRWPPIHQTLCSPGEQLVLSQVVVAQTRLHSSRWLAGPRAEDFAI